MKIQTILDQIDLGSIALPEFQRGYVWNRDQVRSLMFSLYRKYPVGSLLTWVTATDGAKTRGELTQNPGTVKLLLDGQQRITSLYGIINGKPPKFFDGNPLTFTGLFFNLDDETFEFYSPAKMKDNPRWINVTDLMKNGLGAFISRINSTPSLQPNLNLYINRLNAIDTIKQIDLHVEEVSGPDKTVDVVVDIFNRVNSGGTKLSKGDLALAKICASWPEAREEMKKRLTKWRNAGFGFRLEWLLRNVNAILTGEALFSALKDVTTPEFKEALSQTERVIDTLLNTIASRLGLDHERVLGGPGAIPLMARYLAQRDGRFADHRERDRLLYWYVHTFLWGRYAGSAETMLNQDLNAIEDADGALDRLTELLRRNRGDLRLNANDFLGWSKGARFYPMLYMLTRVWKSQDWESGIELSKHLLGYMNQLEVHHIFPRHVLYKNGYAKSEVNALANLTFLTKDTNLLVSNREPEEYLPVYSTKNPGAIESHWIPTDPGLWKVANFREFLEARRELLAKAANQFLDSLLAGTVPEEKEIASIFDRPSRAVSGGFDDEEEERTIRKCNEWVVKHGLPEGEYLYELTDSETGEFLAVLDLAWPNGLQEGYSQPVALLIDEAEETAEAANRAGYIYFTTVKQFRNYVRNEILVSQEVEV